MSTICNSFYSGKAYLDLMVKDFQDLFSINFHRNFI